jgi:IclR family transcriptional regulator, acetate operon repressor
MVARAHAATGRTVPAHGNKSVDRALDVLRRIAAAPTPPITADLQRETGIPKATLHGLVSSLVAAGFVDRAADGRLTVGVVAFEVGAASASRATARGLIGPVLDEVIRVRNETCHVGQLDGGDVVYLEARDSTHGVKFSAPAGTRLPAYGTGLGKAMLSLLSDAEVTALYPPRLTPITAHTLTSRDQLVKQLATFRRLGYATEHEESTDGVACIGAAFPVEGRLFGVSISVPIQRLGDDGLAEVWPELDRATRDAERRLTARVAYGPDEEATNG